ncbi:hypothetical protein BH11BAC3_BH11BAC3_07050 [soil metagenome]
MKIPFLYFLLLSLSWLSAKAQLNESDTVKFQFRASLTGNYQKGNVDVLAVRSKIDFSFSPLKDVVFKSQNSSLYQAFFNKKADNDIFSRNYFYYRPQNRIYPFAIGYISANYRRKIDLRYFGGGGVTYQVLKKTGHVLKLSASAVYEQTNFSSSIYNYSTYNGSSKINVWRGTLFTSGSNSLIEKRLRIFYDAYWQPAFNNKNNYRIQFDAGIDLPVWKGLSFNILYTLAHENVVIEKIKQQDKVLTFGLSYNLKIKS